MALEEYPNKLPANLVYDADAHRYLLDGRILPSVTSVLKECALFEYAYVDYSFAERGTRAHSLCELLDQGALDVTKIESPLIGYLNGWKKFIEEQHPQILAIEEMIFNNVYMYAGRLDRRVILNGHEAVIDIKTGKPANWHTLQTAAYAHGFDRPIERYAVYIGDSRYRIVKHDDSNDWAIFKSCLVVSNYKRKLRHAKES